MIFEEEISPAADIPSGKLAQLQAVPANAGFDRVSRKLMGSDGDCCTMLEQSLRNLMW
jgi:hypothetical protein